MMSACRKWIALSLILAMSAGPGVAWAEGSGGPHGKGHRMGDPERMAEHMIRRLDLDETQAQTVQNIVDAAAPELNALRDRGRKNHEALRDLDAGDPDFDAKLSDLALESGEIMSAKTLLQGRLRAELHAVLTPEQRLEMAESRHRGRDKDRH